MTLYIIIAIICLVIIITIMMRTTDTDGVFISSVFSVILTGAVIMGIFNICKGPEAIDVYNGKTELKISGIYRDSLFIPSDTIVVFKEY